MNLSDYFFSALTVDDDPVAWVWYWSGMLTFYEMIALAQ